MSKRTLPLVSLLWINYPTVQKPCPQPYKNQCAIRLSIALEKSGFPLIGYPENVCRHGHARGAEPLANYLAKSIGQPLKMIRGHSAKNIPALQQGIVFFKDIDGFRGGIGDHIDLFMWGKTKTGMYVEESKEVWFWSLY